MSFEIVYKEDYGHIITVKVEEFNLFTGVTSVVPIGDFSIKQILVEKPDKTVVELDATPVTDGTDGLMEATATLASNVFNQNGYYTFQGRLQSGTQKFTTTEFGYDVKVPIS